MLARCDRALAKQCLRCVLYVSAPGLRPIAPRTPRRDAATAYVPVRRYVLRLPEMELASSSSGPLPHPTGTEIGVGPGDVRWPRSWRAFNKCPLLRLLTRVRSTCLLTPPHASSSKSCACVSRRPVIAQQAGRLRDSTSILRPRLHARCANCLLRSDYPVFVSPGP